jgi:hypothetical protein
MNAELNKLHRWVRMTITEVVEVIALKVRGWIRYYGFINKSALTHLFDRLNERLGVKLPLPTRLPININLFSALGNQLRGLFIKKPTPAIYYMKYSFSLRIEKGRYRPSMKFNFCTRNLK